MSSYVMNFEELLFQGLSANEILERIAKNKDSEDADMDDYYNAIMKETMHELNEYDTRKR